MERRLAGDPGTQETGAGPLGVPLGCDLRLGTESATNAGADEAQLKLPLSSQRAWREAT